MASMSTSALMQPINVSFSSTRSAYQQPMLRHAASMAARN